MRRIVPDDDACAVGVDVMSVVGAGEGVSVD
jgi:hypothetical protein